MNPFTGYEPADLIRMLDVAESAVDDWEAHRDKMALLWRESHEVIDPQKAGLEDSLIDARCIVRDIIEALALTPEGREAWRREQPRESWT